MARPPKHPVDVKLKIVLSVLQGESTQAEAARRRGVSDLHQWVGIRRCWCDDRGAGRWLIPVDVEKPPQCGAFPSGPAVRIGGVNIERVTVGRAHPGGAHGTR